MDADFWKPVIDARRNIKKLRKEIENQERILKEHLDHVIELFTLKSDEEE